MKRVRKITVLLAAVMLMAAMSFEAFADVYFERNIRNADTVSLLSSAAKGRANDVIAIAQTQDGYTGGIAGVKRYSYFTDIWGPGRSCNYDGDKKVENGNWCSEFAFWCLVQAKVLNGTEKLGDVNAFREYFKDSMYMMKASAFNCDEDYHLFSQSDIVDSWFAGYEARGILHLSDLQTGDILQICRDRAKDQVEPHHTVIFHHYSGNKVYVIEGNVGVNKAKTNSYVRSVTLGSYEAHEVIAVLRPDYYVD